MRALTLSTTPAVHAEPNPQQDGATGDQGLCGCRWQRQRKHYDRRDEEHVAFTERQRVVRHTEGIGSKRSTRELSRCHSLDWIETVAEQARRIPFAQVVGIQLAAAACGAGR
jgi:hypothetical protein